MYGLFYLLENPSVELSPAVYYLREVFKDFNPTIKVDKKVVSNLAEYLPEFTEMFNELIEEIFSPEIPFYQTKNNENCKWCAFKGICNK